MLVVCAHRELIQGTLTCGQPCSRHPSERGATDRPAPREDKGERFKSSMVKSLSIPTRGSVGRCLVVVPASTVIISHPCSGCWFILTPVLAGWIRLALLPCGRRASNGVSGGKVGGWGLSQPQAPTEGALPPLPQPSPCAWESAAAASHTVSPCTLPPL